MTVMERGNKALIPWGRAARDGATRPMPQNCEAEQALLGCLLVRNDCLADIREIVRAEHFYEGAHALIFEAICLTVDQGRTASPLTLKPYFDHEDSLTEVGGALYLAKLAGWVASVSSAPDYARAVVDSALRRNLIELCDEVSTRALDPRIEDPPELQLATLGERLDVLRGFMPAGGFIDHGELLMGAAENAHALMRGDRRPGISTGLRALDEMIGGFRETKFYVAAGHTSMGKTTFGWHFAEAAAAPVAPATPAGVLFFSGEMSREDIGERELARRLGISVDIIANGRMTSGQVERSFDEASRAGSVPLWVDDGRMSPRQIIDRSRAMKRRHPGIRLVVIDFIQQIRSEQRRPSSESRSEELGQFAYALKSLAKELGIAVLALSQLRRLGKGENPKPTVDRLRESGDIENAADVVLLLHRRHYYERDAPAGDAERADWEADRDVTEVIIGKQRQGPTGTVRVRSELATNRLSDDVPREGTNQSDLGFDERWEREP